jgi:hypothetical protein
MAASSIERLPMIAAPSSADHGLTLLVGQLWVSLVASRHQR